MLLQILTTEFTDSGHSLANVALPKSAVPNPMPLFVIFTAMLVYAASASEVRRTSPHAPRSTWNRPRQHPQEEKWGTRRSAIIDHHMELTEGLQRAPDLIFWPEAAFPAVLPPEITDRGAQGLDRPSHGRRPHDGVIPEDWPPKDSIRSALQQRGAGGAGRGVEAATTRSPAPVGGTYLSRHFPFIGDIVPAMSSFTWGSGFHLMAVDGKKFGVTICYEDLFPDLLTKHDRARTSW
jgi:apolipoprotein N-acyltransferase